jgi:hypothetical protein
LRKQLLNIIQAFSGLETQLMRLCAIDARLRGLLNCLQTSAKRFVHHLPKRGPQLLRDSARPVQDIVINSQRRSHEVIIASLRVMSTHHPSGGWFSGRVARFSVSVTRSTT